MTAKTGPNSMPQRRLGRWHVASMATILLAATTTTLSKRITIAFSMTAKTGSPLMCQGRHTASTATISSVILQDKAFFRTVQHGLSSLCPELLKQKHTISPAAKLLVTTTMILVIVSIVFSMMGLLGLLSMCRGLMPHTLMAS